jgi:hypothetical protein
VVADKQGSEIFPVSFRQRVAADNELLGFGDLEFDPGTAAPAECRFNNSGPEKSGSFWLATSDAPFSVAKANVHFPPSADSLHP